MFTQGLRGEPGDGFMSSRNAIRQRTIANRLKLDCPFTQFSPVTNPLLYGGGSAASYAAVLNNGWATTYPTISITGPFTGLTIGNYTQGNYISISGTYTDTDVITIDLNSKVISLNGVSARNLMVGGSKWFSAPPGTSQFYMTASGTSSGITQGTITWRSAYT